MENINNFEYKEVYIDNRKKQVYLDCIKNFGWEKICEVDNNETSEMTFKRCEGGHTALDDELENSLDLAMKTKFTKNKSKCFA